MRGSCRAIVLILGGVVLAGCGGPKTRPIPAVGPNQVVVEIPGMR